MLIKPFKVAVSPLYIYIIYMSFLLTLISLLKTMTFFLQWNKKEDILNNRAIHSFLCNYNNED